MNKVLIHACCAPCAGSVVESLRREGDELAVFFYNPNIHPQEEYETRKRELAKYADKLKVPFIAIDEDKDLWFRRTKDNREDPERGERCRICFMLRFERAAAYASQNGFTEFTSTLGISRWKDFDQVSRAGLEAAARFEGLTYRTFNWRKNNGSQRMAEISREENFYRQKYCGCIYSVKTAGPPKV